MAELEPGWVVHEASVEALFVRAFGPRVSANPACSRALKELGIDVSGKLQGSYRASTYEQGMRSLRKHLFAEVAKDADAFRLIGRETTAGYYRTVLGTAIGVVMKMLKPERMLPRLPNNITAATNFMKSTIVEKAPQHFELYVYGSNTPEFVAGAVERAVEQTGTRPRVEIVREAPLEYWFSIQW